MLTDPLTVKHPTLSAASAITVATTESFATTDVAPGKSVRQCSSSFLTGGGNAMPAILTIAHSVSNDNKPVLTDRTLIRFDNRVTNVAGAELNAYGYAVFGVPRGATDGNDAIDVVRLVQQLVGLLAVSPSAATLSSANILRILAGEP